MLRAPLWPPFDMFLGSPAAEIRGEPRSQGRCRSSLDSISSRVWSLDCVEWRMRYRSWIGQLFSEEQAICVPFSALVHGRTSVLDGIETQPETTHFYANRCLFQCSRDGLRWVARCGILTNPSIYWGIIVSMASLHMVLSFSIVRYLFLRI